MQRSIHPALGLAVAGGVAAYGAYIGWESRPVDRSTLSSERLYVLTTRELEARVDVCTEPKLDPYKETMCRETSYNLSKHLNSFTSSGVTQDVCRLAVYRLIAVYERGIDVLQASEARRAFSDEQNRCEQAVDGRTSTRQLTAR